MCIFMKTIVIVILTRLHTCICVVHTQIDVAITRCCYAGPPSLVHEAQEAWASLGCASPDAHVEVLEAAQARSNVERRAASQRKVAGPL